MPGYTPKAIEPKWQRYWEENRTFRTTEQADKQKHSDEEQHVDPRHEDLAVMRLRGVAYFEPRQKTELDRLPGEGICAGNDGLACDHRRDRRQTHHRQQSPIRIE